MKKKEQGILSVSTIEIPQTTGIVLSVGNEVKEIKKGDHVLFHPFDELPLLDKKTVAVRDKSILAILEE